MEDSEFLPKIKTEVGFIPNVYRIECEETGKKTVSRPLRCEFVGEDGEKLGFVNTEHDLVNEIGRPPWLCRLTELQTGLFGSRLKTPMEVQHGPSFYERRVLRPGEREFIVGRSWHSVDCSPMPGTLRLQSPPYYEYD